MYIEGCLQTLFSHPQCAPSIKGTPLPPSRVVWKQNKGVAVIPSCLYLNRVLNWNSFRENIAAMSLGAPCYWWGLVLMQLSYADHTSWWPTPLYQYPFFNILFFPGQLTSCLCKKLYTSFEKLTSFQGIIKRLSPLGATTSLNCRPVLFDRTSGYMVSYEWILSFVNLISVKIFLLFCYLYVDLVTLHKLQLQCGHSKAAVFTCLMKCSF